MKLFTSILFSASCYLFFPFGSAAQQLLVANTRCEYQPMPIGIDVLKPRFSWQLQSSENNIVQTAYEIRVARSLPDVRAGKNLIWSSGKMASNQSLYNVYAGSPLSSATTYFWQVKVWDNKGHASPWSQVSVWEMGLLKPEEWSAQWIEPNETTNGKVTPAPAFRKEFSLGKKPERARLYITAHGVYEAEINGRRVGDHYFTPGWTSYHKRLQYQTYDVTKLLLKGANAIGVTVGDGWYRGNLEFNHKRNLYGKEAGLLAQLEVTFSDGSKEVINTNEGWMYSFDGPVRASDIYNGETYDARMIQTGWSEHNFADAKWLRVKTVETSKTNLVAPNSPPVVRQEKFGPVKFITSPKGERIIDFGQNLVGWVTLRLKGTPGQRVTVTHAEVLDKMGNFYTANLRDAKQENVYILNGSETSFEPRFSFQGFRYIKVEGYQDKLDSTNVSAVALYSDMEPAGRFVTSNPLINQLQHNIQWGQRGNFLDVPTDCPQRDERLGWTADAQVFFNTAAYNMDVSGFFAKWLQDLRTDQLETGNVPVVIPNVREKRFSGSAGWADAATIIPWHFYLNYGDRRMLEEQYSSMKAWVEFIRTSSRNNLSTVGSTYGDWLFFSPTDDRYGRAALTDRNFIAQIFYAYSTRNVLNAARVLGKADDMNTYAYLLNDIRKAFQHEYLTPSGRLVSSSQTAYVLALQFDMLPEPLRAQAAARLVENIRDYKDHLTTGFLGTSYLCPVLSRFGYDDVAYTLLLQDTYPSWLYPVKMGATTIWERWDGIKPDSSFQNEAMNSFNHYSYGAIGDWMYKVMAGINTDSNQTGYKRFIIAPRPGGGVTEVNAERETPFGLVKSGWKISNGKINIDITIPSNTTAVVLLPKAAGREIKNENTKNGISSLTQADAADGSRKIEIGSGNYRFEYSFK